MPRTTDSRSSSPASSAKTFRCSRRTAPKIRVSRGATMRMLPVWWLFQSTLPAMRLARLIAPELKTLIAEHPEEVAEVIAEIHPEDLADVIADLDKETAG